MRAEEKNGGIGVTTVLVHPYRYKNDELEYLLIKRKRVAYNWQGVSGSVEENETTEECAIRELFEETGYIPASVTPINLPADFHEGTEGKGEIWEGHYNGDSYIKLQKDTLFIARIDQKKDPVLNPEEHTDWIWCKYEKAYEIIKWDLEKRFLRYINNMLITGEIKEK
ncbi:MAG: NUDIX domain-containing protein [Candidatus Bathyarchaeota archaeon]|jgi:dATP pyrophosphohydrolase